MYQKGYERTHLCIKCTLSFAKYSGSSRSEKVVATRNGHVDLSALVLYISNTEVYKIFINERLAQCAVSLKCWFIWIRLWVVSLKTKECPVGQSQKWSLSLAKAIHYKVWVIVQIRGFTKVVVKLVAYEWVRKDCFDCIALHVLLSARGGAGRVGSSQSGQFNNNKGSQSSF